MLRALLILAALLLATPSAQAAPRLAPSARCLLAASTIGFAASAPGIIPLWTAGAAKGMAVAQGIQDIRAARSVPAGTDHNARRVQYETQNLWFTATMALLGSIVATGVLWPPFAALVTSTVVVMMHATDGLWTGLCRQPVDEERPASLRARTALYVAGLLALGALPAPMVVLPTAAGVFLVLITLRMFPAFPLVPGLGFVDLPANFKRAGVLQTAGWPMVFITSAATAVALTLLVLELGAGTAPAAERE